MPHKTPNGTLDQALRIAPAVGRVLDRAGVGTGPVESLALLILVSRMFRRVGLDERAAGRFFGSAWHGSRHQDLLEAVPPPSEHGPN